MKNAAILHLSRHYADGRADVRRDSRYGFAGARYKISFKFQYR